MSEPLTPYSFDSGAPDPVERRVRGNLDIRYATLVRALRRTQRMSDSEAVHDTRVATRRLTAALGMWRDHLSPALRRRAARALGKLRRTLGKTRDREVQLELMRSLVEQRPKSDLKPIKRLIREQKERVHRSREKAAKKVKGSKTREVLSRTRRAIKSLVLDSGSDLHPIGIAVDTINDQRERAIRSLEHAFEEASDGLLHEARIEVKRWRYGLECAGVLVPERYLISTDTLKDFQQILGEIHDYVTLHDLLVAHCDRFRESGRPKRALALRPWLDFVDVEKHRKIDQFRKTWRAEKTSLSAARIPPAAKRPHQSPSPPEGPPAFPEDPSVFVLPRSPAEHPDGSSQES